jgi:hypothetical protein
VHYALIDPLPRYAFILHVAVTERAAIGLVAQIALRRNNAALIDRVIGKQLVRALDGSGRH